MICVGRAVFYYNTRKYVGDCAASRLKSDIAFEHAVPGKKIKCPSPLCLAESGSETSGRDPIITSVKLLRLLPSPTLSHALHVKKIALIHQTNQLRLQDHSDKTHYICSPSPKIKKCQQLYNPETKILNHSFNFHNL